jgi:hypothetical protein
MSSSAQIIGAAGPGIWGDGGAGSTSFAYGVLGTVDDGQAGTFVNDSRNIATLVASNLNSFGFPFFAVSESGASCNIDSAGSINCTGSKNAVVPIDGGRRIVAVSAIEAPQNWFEDAGSAQLINGAAVVALDPDYIQTVNTGEDYKVFPVPNGDCKGLYVTNKTPASFEVRELGGGTSNIVFDYRIMALRKNYESIRFADHTNDPDPRKMIERMKRARPQARPSVAPGISPASPDSGHGSLQPSF